MIYEYKRDCEHPKFVRCEGCGKNGLRKCLTIKKN